MTKRYIITIFLFCITALSIVSQNVIGQDGYIFYHTVEQGQTVYGISIMYHVSEEDIYNLNPSSRESIKIGETLRIPQKDTVNSAMGNDLYIFHTIQPGENIFRISQQYNITQEQLVNANMGLSPQTFAAGKTIRIPANLMQAIPVTERIMVTKELEYTVKRGDSMFRLTRNFNVTSDKLLQLNPELSRGLKTGMVIKIPVETEEIVTILPNANEYDINVLMAYRNSFQQVDNIKIALLLPLASSNATINQARIEFYEGFLMAVENMRNYGVSIELTPLDIGDGTQKIREILQNEPLGNYHLFIGGETYEQIELIANYALKNNIKYVIPFSSSTESLTLTNANVFQVNTASQNLYAYVTSWACSLFSNYNIIFVNANDQKEDKSSFVRSFKADLTQRSITFHSINFNANTFYADVNNCLSATKPNLIVPQSSSLETLNKIKGPLRTLTERRSAPQISLFGYPEWQLFTNECLEDFYALNTYIYTSSFANNQSADVQRFHANYRYWYSKNMIQSYLRYAILGYDMGMYFMSAIQKFGLNFENNLRQVNHRSLQNGFQFERVNNWGGFMNTNLYFVNYNKDFTITRFER